jgi:hypothetical protein
MSRTITRAAVLLLCAPVAGWAFIDAVTGWNPYRNAAALLVFIGCAMACIWAAIPEFFEE